MNFRTLALSALTLAALAPAAFAGSTNDPRSCIIQPHSARGDGVYCNPFMSSDMGTTETRGLKAAGTALSTGDWVKFDTRGSSQY